MDACVVHQPLRFKQITVCIRGAFLLTAGSGMAGCVHPAMMNVIAAAGAVSSFRTAAPAQDLRSRLTRGRWWRSRHVPGGVKSSDSRVAQTRIS